MTVEIVKPVKGSVTIDFDLAVKLFRLVGQVNSGNNDQPHNADLREFFDSMSEALGVEPGQSSKASPWDLTVNGNQIYITPKSTGTDVQWT